MSSMYSLKSFDQVHVTPTEFMYRMKSYHADSGISTNKPSCSSKDTITDSKLTDMMKEAVDMTLKFVNELTEYFSTVSIHSTAGTDSNKKKKEENKKVDVKSQSKTSGKKETSPPQQQSRADGKPKMNSQNEKSFDGHSRGHAVFTFKFQEYEKINGKLEIVAGPNYSEIIKLVKDIADGRGVGQSIIIKQNNSKELKATLTASDGKKVEIDKSVDVFIVIGELLGIYSKQDRHLENSQDWLSRTVNVLSDTGSLDELVRSLSLQLGPFDLLNKTTGITIADVVVFSIVKSEKYLPNNVEMFVKRISEVLSIA